MRVYSFFSLCIHLARHVCALAVLAVFAMHAAPPAHAATPATATSSAQAAPANLDDGLLSYWPFDEGSGTTSIDYGGSGNHVTFHSAAGFTNVTPALDHDNPSAFKSVDNPNSYGTAPGTNIDNLQQFTISFWVRLNATPQHSMSLITLPGKASLMYDTNVFNSPIFFTVYVDSPFIVSRGISLYGTQPGAYYHVTATYGSNGMHVFLNGQAVNDLPGSYPLKPGSGVTFSAPDTPFDGALDDVRIYNRVLSDTEIARLAFRCGSVTEIPQSECHALADIYLNTNGAGWTNHAGWLQNNTPCSWYGVLCNNGHVLALILTNNGLRGTLPFSLNDLTSLVSLGLGSNQLSGQLPPLYSGLTKLQALDLSQNQLSGELPAQLGYLSSLQSLNLNSNMLRGDISTLITHLTNLISLNLSYNALNPTDSGVRDFLTAHQANWAATQTVPPTNIHAVVQSATSVLLTWTPIAYTGDGGYYEVLSSDPFTGLKSLAKTTDKLATSITVTGLTNGQTYPLVVRSVTPKHGTQQNDVTSDPSDPINVTVTLPVNHPPVAQDDSYTAMAGQTLAVDALHGILLNDSDQDLTPLSAIKASDPAHGSLTLNPDGSFSYTPASGFSGTDSFTYKANDGANDSNVATVTITVGAPAAACLTTPVRDTFDRANGNIGSNWSGRSGLSGYRIVNGQLHVVGGGPLYWHGNPSFDPSQEVFVTLAAVDPQGGEQDLLLKVQGSTANWRNGVIEAVYDARAGAVHVETYRPGQRHWTIYPSIAATLQNGDRFGAQALADGTLRLFKNCTLLGTLTLNATDQAFFNSKGGAIGLWFINAPNAVLDDFGGGALGSSGAATAGIADPAHPPDNDDPVPPVNGDSDETDTSSSKDPTNGIYLPLMQR
ncbi:MAG TPA: Ig-like domain-containing protein [Roseiflexaceae bacterium]|nr:Ig-like domain-containing protein [Roseiflexaceae bacterium]